MAEDRSFPTHPHWVYWTGLLALGGIVITFGGVFTALAVSSRTTFDLSAYPGFWVAVLGLLIAFLAFLGLVRSWDFPFARRRRNERNSMVSSVRLAAAEGAVFSDVPGGFMIFWLHLRAINHGQPTVLTDWSAVLTLGDSTFAAVHRSNEPPLAQMKDSPSLDQATALTPLHGEITGWVAFNVGLTRTNIRTTIEQGLPAKICVSVQDIFGKTSEVEIDVAQLWKDMHKDFTS